MKTNLRTGNIALFILLTLAPLLVSAKINVQTRVQPNDLEVAEAFNVSVEVTSEDSVQVTPPTAPAIDGARLIGSHTSQRINSSTVQNEQGELQFKTVRTMVYNFNYQALKNGDLIVPAVDVVINGQSMKSSPAQVKVYAQGAGGRRGQPQQQQQRGRKRPFPDDDDMFSADPFEQMAQMEDTFNQLLQRRFGGAGGFQALPSNIDEKDAFIIVAEVDKTEAYKGEQLTATWYLYTKAGVRDIDTLKYPDLKGFWKEDIELATLLNFQPAELGGKQYNRALLASYALFPIDEGKAIIDPYKAKVTVVGGFGKALTTVKSSEPIPILVKPLPTEGRPASFSGAVGEYQITAQLESKSVVAHQPFSLKVHVEGRGNAKQFELPNPQLPASVELYDIKKDSKFFKNGMSFKDFEIFMIAREAGELVIPPISTAIFNPRSGKYETLSTQEFRINVMPGSGQQGMASTRIGDASAAQPEEKLNLLTEWEPRDVHAKPNPVIWAVFYGGAAAAIFGFAAFTLGWFRKPLSMREKYEMRVQKLKKVSAQNKWRETGIEATNLSYYVLGEISGLGGANVQIEKLLEKAPPSVRRDIGAELQKVMNRFYLLGFGPDVAVQSAGNENSVNEDIKKLEKLLSKAIQLSESEGHS